MPLAFGTVSAQTLIATLSAVQSMKMSRAGMIDELCSWEENCISKAAVSMLYVITAQCRFDL